MKLDFRQGLVQHQTDNTATQLFLQRNGQAVSLYVSPTPTLISFAHKDADYLYTESATVPNAWAGPFVSGTDYWLYWDLNPISGLRTFGHTTRAPIASPTRPGSAAMGQHWFDLTEVTMKEWNGFIWKPVIRVFAAKYAGAALFTSMALGTSYTGTQVGLRAVCHSGALVFDGLGKAVKTASGTFFTSESGATILGLSSAVKFAAMTVEAEVQEPVPAFSWVYFSDFNKINLANPHTPASKPCGMIEIDAVQGMITHVITGGIVQNNYWNWTTVNARVYVGFDGIVVLDPIYPGQPSVGYVIAHNAILIREAAAASSGGTEGPMGPPGPEGPPGPAAESGGAVDMPYIQFIVYQEFELAPGMAQTFHANDIAAASPWDGDIREHPAGHVYSDIVPSLPTEDKTAYHRFIPATDGIYLIEFGLMVHMNSDAPVPITIEMDGGFLPGRQDIVVTPQYPGSLYMKRSVVLTALLSGGQYYALNISNMNAAGAPVTIGFGSFVRFIKLSSGVIPRAM